MRISFLGAAGTVTGSRHLLVADSKQILIDCGLFQGVKSLRLRNREPIPFDPKSLDAVVLTHAHLDHTGYLPVLVKEGYTGPIYCTPPTADLVPILLADSGHLQEEDARWARKKGYSRHANPEPLYTQEDALAVTPQLRPVPFATDVDLGGVKLRYTLAGHILGAASATFTTKEGTVLFSGDLGRPYDLLIPTPEPPARADWVVMEATYGAREHPTMHPVEALALILKRTAKRGGVLMIPAFSVGRSQLMLYALHLAFESGMAPRLPVFLNSPMAIDVSDLYLRHADFHRLSAKEVRTAFGVAEYTRTVAESKGIQARSGPMVVIAGAGMLTGGRILHHLAQFAPDPRSTIVLTGHQAEGTRGADLLAGKTSVKIHGGPVPVRAEVATLYGLSGHADQSELLDWLGASPTAPRTTFLVHAEPVQADGFRRAAQDRLGLHVQAAEDGRTVVLE